MDVISILQVREAVALERLVICLYSHNNKQKRDLISSLSHSRVHSPFYFLTGKNKPERKEGKNKSQK